jgi:hypothetical protein
MQLHKARYSDSARPSIRWTLASFRRSRAERSFLTRLVNDAAGLALSPADTPVSTASMKRRRSVQNIGRAAGPSTNCIRHITSILCLVSRDRRASPLRALDTPDGRIALL